MAEAGSVQLNQRAGSIGIGNNNIGEAVQHLRREQSLRQLDCMADGLVGRLSSSIPAVRQSAFRQLSAFARSHNLTNDDVLKAAEGARGRVGKDPTAESDARDLACVAPPRLRQGGFPGGNIQQELHRHMAPRNP